MSDNSFAGINFSDPESKYIFRNNLNTMCPRYKEINENNFDFEIELETKSIDNNSFIINGKVETNIMSDKLYVKYVAANPPTYNSNFSGSGLPYPNEDVAFENTPNKGSVEVVNGNFTISIKYPNSYYINMGTVYVEPSIKLSLFNINNKQIGKVKNINLGEGIPFRSLTWTPIRNWNNGPLFYENSDLPVRTQYQILLDSSYPLKNKMPKNFWGIMPPH